MKKMVLFCLSIMVFLFPKAQDLDKSAAMQLVKNNFTKMGISQEQLNNLIVTNAYTNKLPGTEMVYVQQTYKEIPVLNHLLVLAFKNGELVSKTGTLYNGFERNGETLNASPAISAETAARTAIEAKKQTVTSSFKLVQINPRKFDLGKAGVSQENITVELLWALVNKKMELVWQVFFTPKKSADYWLIRVDAHENHVTDETNLTVYCNWKKPLNAGAQTAHQHSALEHINPAFETAKIPALPAHVSNKQEFAPLSPAIVNNAAYRVVRFPIESPSHTGGTPVLVNNPWSAAAGNATSLKWHNDGTTDYTYTRGNNVWAYHDRQNQNFGDPFRSATSSTGPEPLSFDFIPNFRQRAYLTSPAPNQQFNTTNLFYWSNIVHDVVYQYGFDEASGNFQMSNQGRGGAGGDYVRAEAQDGSGTDNANFATPPDGSSPRMQMFLWTNTPLVVHSPGSIAGRYVSIEGTFSTANQLANLDSLNGQVVYYNDDAGGSLHEACTPPANNITGKIALINRGNCAFTIKVKNAQDAGAIGVIVVNNAPGQIQMGGADNSITIPAVSVSQADGALIAAQLANNVNVTLSNIQIDGDADNGIVVHEFSHGISNRLTGGPAQAGCLSNAEQMGEGWSDYYALMLTQDWAGSNVNTGFTTSRGVGTYANGESPSGFGIRTQRYSTNFAVNNLVYQASISDESHDRGEIWCATLWDMTWNIIQQVNSITPDIYNASGTGGNVIALKLVTEGLKLQPCSPGFIDGRDAILKADQLLFGGQYSCAIREAFRKRGMGINASQGSSASVLDQTPDFSAYISLSLTQNVTQVPEGQNIVYTHKVVSCGPLTNYVLTDTLPANVTHVSGGTYNAGTRVVSFPINFTTAGSQNYSFTVNVNTGTYYTPTTYLNEPVASTTFPATLTATSNTANVWAVSAARSNSAPNSLFTPDAVGFSNQILTTTNPITIGTNQSSLSFWHDYNTEAGWDGGVLEISTDNGASWVDLGPKMVAGYYNASIAPTNNIPISGRAAFTGTTNGFINSSVNLSAYAGQSAKFRWAFYSDEFEGATGWYVDDILVKNEAVVNMRGSLFNGGGLRVAYKDTVTLITQTVACVNAAITTQPANTTVCAGSNSTFTVTATGTTLAYQWQVSTDGGATYTNISGSTTATLTLTAVTAAMNNNRYRVIVSNACPSSVTSTGAVLTVTTPSAISSQPASTTVCSGNSASFTVTATGTSLTYQWEISTNGGTSWTAIGGATSATLTLTGVTATMNNNQYRVVLSSCTPGGLTSTAATLTVNVTAGITTQPLSATVCGGDAAVFSVVATGTAISYQWQLSTDGGSTYNNIPSATASTLNLPAVTASMNNYSYRVIVSNNCPSSVTSTPAVLTVTTPSTITQQPANTTVCSGNNTTITVVATGTTITYQWQVSTNNGTTWTNIGGATAATLSLTAVTTGMNNNQYRVLVSSCTPGGLTSTPAILTVNAGVGITTQPVNTSVCSGTNVTFNVTATGTALSFQWQVSTDGGATFTNIPAATTASLTLNAVTVALNNNQYRVNVSNACPSSLNSATATLSVSDVTAITAQPTSSTVCSGTNTSFSVTATGTNLTYQWQVSTDGGATWTNIAAATASSLNLTAVTAAMNNNRYRVVMPSCVAGGLTSSAATLTVNSAVNITTQPLNTVGCTGNNVNFTSVVTGSGLSYQWQLSTDAGATWSDIPAATNATLTLNAVTATMSGNRYRLIINGTCSPAPVTSNAAILTVSNSVIISQQPVNSTLCAGLNTSFSTTATGSGLTYQWQVSTNGGTSFTNVPGATSATLNLTAVTPSMNGNQYRVVLSGDCVSSLLTNVATLTVNSSVTIVTQPTNQSGCAPVPAVFSVTATGTGITYQWEISVNAGASWNIVPGATSGTLSIPTLTPAQNGDQYRVIVAGVPCGTLTSNSATLSVGVLPTVTIAASSSAVTPTIPATLTATPAPTGSYTYQWFKNEVPVPGVTTSTYVVTVDNIGTYKAVATSSNGCKNVSNEIVLVGGGSNMLYVYPNPTYGTFQVRFYTDPVAALVRTINVYDPRGAKIFTKRYTVLSPYDKMEVNLGGAPSGVYYIELLDASNKKVASAGVSKF